MDIERDGHIFTPRYDENGEIVATAEEVYQEWLQQKNQLPQPTETEVLRDYVLELDYRLILMELGL